MLSIDFFPEGAFRYLDHDAIVCVDIIRATTTLVTAVATGRRAFAATDLAEATRIAGELKDPVLAGAGAALPHGAFELANSPRLVSTRTDVRRPLVLVSADGTRLLANARACPTVYVASLRNLTATAEALAGSHSRIALIGACSSGELRCEDQIAVARLGALLAARGYHTSSRETELVMDRWSAAGAELISLGRSAEHLRKTGQEADLEFILSHVDDLDFACRMSDAEVCRVGEAEGARPRYSDAASAERG